MKLLTEEEEKAYRTSYIAWIEALTNQLGGRASDLHRKILAGARPEDPIKKLTYDSVKHWKTRASIPDNTYGVLDRLISVMKAELNQFPVGALAGLSFEENVSALLQHRAATSQAGKSVEKIGNKLFGSGAISFLPTAASELDELSLNLGSGLFLGALPPYCFRDADEEIQTYLNDANRRLLVLVGQPKSGKTRTMIENLKKSELKNSTVYWVRPSLNSINELLESLPESSTKNTIAILDDLQTFRFDGDGSITPGALTKLMKRCMVVATLHKSSLLGWEIAQVDHSVAVKTRFDSPPAKTVQVLILESSVELDSHLSLTEYANLGNVFPQDIISSQDCEDLGATLSASKVLVTRARELRDSDDPMKIAVFRALISSKILWPQGCSFSDFAQVAKMELESFSNRPWDEAEWESIQKFCTTGMHATSPHSILTRTISNPQIYTLFDPIWPALKPETWSAEISQRFGVLPLDLAYNAYRAGYPTEALRLTASTEIQIDAKSQYWMGFYLAALGDNDAAIGWYRKSAANGEVYSLYNLGHLLSEHGDPHEAELCFREARQAGVVDAIVSLGRLLDSRGDIEGAEELYREAHLSGDVTGTYNLADILREKGEVDEAIELYSVAHQAGDTDATTNLGGLLYQLERRDEARDLYLISYAAGDSIATYNLGEYYQDQGDYEEAEKFYREASEAGLVHAKFALGRLLILENGKRFDEAEKLLREIASDEYPEPYLSLGLITEDVKAAEEFLLKAESAGVPGSDEALVNHYKKLRDPNNSKTRNKKIRSGSAQSPND